MDTTFSISGFFTQTRQFAKQHLGFLLKFACFYSVSTFLIGGIIGFLMVLALIPIYRLYGSLNVNIPYNAADYFRVLAMAGPLLDILFLLFIYALTALFVASVRFWYGAVHGEPVNPVCLWSLFKAAFRDWRFIVRLLWAQVLESLVILGGFILLIVPGFIFMIQYIFVSFILVLEPATGIRQAFRRSKAMTNGMKGKLFRMGVAWLLVILAAVFVQQIVFGILGIPFTLPGSTAQAAWSAISRLCGNFITMFLQTLMQYSLVLVYIFLRKRIDSAIQPAVASAIQAPAQPAA
jgi:hypothetical protein